VPALDVSVGFTDKFSAEAFYQWGWRPTEIDPKGTYFSTNDFISPGATEVFVVGAGGLTLPGLSDNPPTPGTFAPRAGDRNPRDFGEFGVALRYFEPALNETEFGFYYIHYHSRLPLISAQRVTDPFGVPILPGILCPGILGPSCSPASGNYFVEYPDDIDLLGASFNTEIGATGIALQGEVSYRFDQPLQIDDSELLIAALNLCGVSTFTSQLDKNGLGVLDGCGFAAGEDITGFRQKDVLQAQATVTEVLGATFGVDQVVLLGEAGLTWVPDLEATSVLRYEGPGTGPGDPGNAAAQTVPLQTDGFADKFSWGYRLVGQLLFNDAIGPVNLAPQVAFAHDVEGVTPSPIGNFVEDRKTVTLSLSATYLNAWEAKLSYTNFFGASRSNVLNDRDFVSTVVSYAF